MAPRRGTARADDVDLNWRTKTDSRARNCSAQVEGRDSGDGAVVIVRAACLWNGEQRTESLPRRKIQRRLQKFSERSPVASGFIATGANRIRFRRGCVQDGRLRQSAAIV